MRIEEAVFVESPLEEVWPLLQDIPRVVACLPGANLYSEDDSGGTFRGAIEVAFGPTRAIFEGNARIALDQDSHTVRIEARGTDQTGRSKARANVAVSVAALESSHARLVVDGSIEVIGPLAPFAETGGVHIAKELMGSFAQCLASQLDQRLGGRIESGAAPIPLLSLLLASFMRWLKGFGRRFRIENEVQSK